MVGANSILIYVMSWTVAEPLRDVVMRHLGDAATDVLGAQFVKLFSAAIALAMLYYVLLWLYRRQAFVKI